LHLFEEALIRVKNYADAQRILREPNCPIPALIATAPGIAGDIIRPTKLDLDLNPDQRERLTIAAAEFIEAYRSTYG
jgi:hypothetical protein